MYRLQKEVVKKYIDGDIGGDKMDGDIGDVGGDKIDGDKIDGDIGDIGGDKMDPGKIQTLLWMAQCSPGNSDHGRVQDSIPSKHVLNRGINNLFLFIIAMHWKCIANLQILTH